MEFLFGKRRLTHVLPLYSQLKIFCIGISSLSDKLFKLSQRLFKSESVLEKEYSNIVTNLNEISDITGIMNAKKEDTKMKKLETSIDDLDFSVRAYNCLKRAGVNTLGDLTAKSEIEMMKIRNLGKKSLKEVIEKVKDMGLKFREDD